MGVATRRVIGAAVAVVLLALGAGGTLFLQQRQRDDAAAAADREAERVRDVASGALAKELRKLQTRVESAANLPELRAQIGVVDARTLKDGFSSEPWWAAVRREAPVTALAVNGDAIDLAIGATEADLEATALVHAAREGNQSVTGLVRGAGIAYLGAAAVVPKPGRGAAPVLVLMRPADDELLAAIAKQAGGAVVISDGSRALGGAGPASLRAALEKRAAGEKKVGPPMASAQLAPGSVVWAAAPAAVEPSSTPPILFALWGAAGLAALGALAFGFKKPAPPPLATVPPPAPAPAPPPDAEVTQHSGNTAPGGVAKPALPHGEEPASTNPNQFGRYTLLDLLGEGGMAEVYTAVAFGAENFRRAFVVKRLRKSLIGRQDLVNMFIDEARLGSSLVHSNIIPVFDFGKVGDEYFMATEYVLGRDLRKITERAIELDGKPPSHELVVYVAREVLRALDYAHKLTGDDGKPLGLVHRDISPNNLLVSLRGEVKLFDFGIAKAEGRLTQTQVGGVKGNYRFMSSEQAYGDPVDPRSDVCSLGLTMFFALTGESFYRGDTMVEVLRAAAMGPTDKDWERVSQLPDGVREAVWASVQLSAKDRWQSALEFLEALAPIKAMDAAAAAKEMNRLCGDELRKEWSRFQGLGRTGTTDPRAARPPGSTGVSKP